MPAAERGLRPAVIRFYDADAGKQSLHSLGDFGHLPASERFSTASAEAREWFAHVVGGGARR